MPFAMPSFDIVSEVDTHELTNAVDQANRELSTRFDFKGVEASFVLEDKLITQSAPSDFQLQKITVKQGIERELAKKLQAAIKDAKLKVEAQINGDKLRVTGKKRDDLQATMALLRAQEFERPLQFDNFRD